MCERGKGLDDEGGAEDEDEVGGPEGGYFCEE